MLPLPAVQDIQTYLSDNAWQQARMWRGASVWSHADGYEVLLPPRDDLADTDLRVRECLSHHPPSPLTEEEVLRRAGGLGH
jgi:hypothetical protein